MQGNGAGRPLTVWRTEPTSRHYLRDSERRGNGKYSLATVIVEKINLP